MIALTYQYKLRPNQQQEAEINQILDVSRIVYNYALRERKDWLSSKKSPINSCSIISEYIIPADTPYPSYNNQAKSLTIAKKTNPKLKSVNAQVLQQTLKTLDQAFSEMKSLGKGFPRFKKKLRSFVFPAMLKNCLGYTKVKLPQLGWIKIRKSRPYPEAMTAKQARIVKKASGYYLMITFTSSESVPDNPVGKVSLGVDAGIENFVATSTGQLIKSPKFLLSQLRELKLLQRRLKKKTIRSNNWFKYQNKIAKLHEKIANTRRDWHFKLAHQLCNLADNIFVEDINFNSWSRGIVRKQSLDSGIGQFINEILPFVCWKRGKYYAKVDKNHTSQECPGCGQRQKKKLSERSHNCSSCGYQINRDIAAAKVIRNRGLIAVGHTVNQNACGDVLAGVQLSLFDLLPS
ncbi:MULTISPECIES: RNA-guided endonuclease TnpB family protein [Okeania]|uniref:Transposase n=1 Tax=Okeania hirsuta TaxID=1458930 RepID=A0A3N6PI60_9CYAN|nr:MULTISPECIES: RNA-guided endonuclease TnpB family protein [Okeania]NET11724.1 transposase [Okeania sp. SIO1H6]NES74681.1 transposase [Okeania sp. SIO1H4]NES91837.1 transposase [Okeania sp. SIO2B9]NET18783.1 transposase [Okeania sp. SIO1H5]NET74858.1 transposase [Okeania sp. SIO1F9]